MATPTSFAIRRQLHPSPLNLQTRSMSTSTRFRSPSSRVTENIAIRDWR